MRGWLIEKTALVAGIENHLPRHIGLARKGELHRPVVRIEKHEKRIVADWLPVRVAHIHGIATEEHREAAHMRGIP